MYGEHHQHHEDGQDDNGPDVAAETFVGLVIIELQFTDLASLVIEPSIFVVAIRNVGISAHEIIFFEVTFKKNGEGWKKRPLLECGNLRTMRLKITYGS